MRRWAEDGGWATWVWAEGSSLSLTQTVPPRPLRPKKDARPPRCFKRFRRINDRSARGGTWPNGRVQLSSAVASTLGPLRQTNALALAGCELSGHTRSFTFKVEEEDDTEHVLALNMVRDWRVVGDAGSIYASPPPSPPDWESLTGLLTGYPRDWAGFRVRCLPFGLSALTEIHSEVLCTLSAVPYRGGQGRV